MEDLSVVKSEIICIDEEFPENILPLNEENCIREETLASFGHAQSTEQGTEENICTSEEMQFAFVNCDEGWDIEVHETGVLDDKEDVILEDESTLTIPSEELVRLPSSGLKAWSDEKKIPHACYTRIGETYYCIPCDIPFHRQSDFNSHITKTHKRITCFQCPKCEKSFRFQSKLLEHIVIHSDIKPFSCTVCARQFSRFGDVKKHMFKRHKSTAKSNINIQRIDLSNYYTHGNSTIVENGNLYRSHSSQQKIDIIAKKRKHICYHCCELFTSEGELTWHISTIHGHQPTNMYQCPKCGNSSSNAYELLEHMDQHSSSWKHNCNKCKKTFVRRTKLILHMQEHAAKITSIPSKLMPVRQILKGDYPCKFCGKIFAWPSRLREHMATHTKELLFKCDICKKGFSTKTGFMYHAAKHTNTGLHPCPRCEKKFCRNSELSNHLRTHLK